LLSESMVRKLQPGTITNEEDGTVATRGLWIMSLFMALGGVALTVAGFRSEETDAVMSSLRWLGPIVLGAGVLLAGLGLLLHSRE
jgi:hypothetical protein